jgi:hypothetical protein
MFATLNFVLILSTWAVAGWTIVVGVPMFARARFAEQVTALRDAVADEVLRGDLPRADGAVLEFLDVTHGMATRPEDFGLTEAMAVHQAHVVLGEAPEPLPSYSDLAPAQRRRMHEAEAELTSLLRTYLLFGSQFWLLLAAGLLARRALYKIRPERAAVSEHGSVPGHFPLDVRAEALAQDMREDAKHRVPRVMTNLSHLTVI